ncbi:hypothetical protein Bpfe_001047 [Biomphalaria pfeifferi]|uniref:Uncharacterized protein n=1 Tax=Biomphalaria pfeifferi TaxID=112525 RepID=A0AAD8CD69_BIOPF|nr:hypothetical protein Bpfe_001047 [Biomphalaria pfeifferi]
MRDPLKNIEVVGRVCTGTLRHGAGHKLHQQLDDERVMFMADGCVCTEKFQHGAENKFRQLGEDSAVFWNIDSIHF